MEDFLYWKFQKSGKFTVKIVYAMLLADDMEQNMSDPACGFYKILWSPSCNYNVRLSICNLYSIKEELGEF